VLVVVLVVLLGVLVELTAAEWIVTVTAAFGADAEGLALG
jgi:hypothetical protein